MPNKRTCELVYSMSDGELNDLAEFINEELHSRKASFPTPEEKQLWLSGEKQNAIISLQNHSGLSVKECRDLFEAWGRHLEKI